MGFIFFKVINICIQNFKNKVLDVTTFTSRVTGWR
jgi:hypothetical protein